MVFRLDILKKIYEGNEIIDITCDIVMLCVKRGENTTDGMANRSLS